MHGYNSQSSLSPQQARSNTAGLQDYADYSMYNIWVPATALVDTTGTALVSYNNDAPVKLYPDAATTSSAYSFRKPRHWISGVVTARIHYTGTEEKSKAIYMGLRFDRFRENDTLSAGTYGYVSATSPDATGYYMIEDGFEDLSLTTYNSSILVEDPDRLITLSFTREGLEVADTYTLDLELIGLEVFYREYKHTNYHKVRDIKWTS